MDTYITSESLKNNGVSEVYLLSFGESELSQRDLGVSHLRGIVTGEGVGEGGGGSEGRGGYDLPFLQLGHQLLTAAVQVVQAGLGAPVLFLTDQGT